MTRKQITIYLDDTLLEQINADKGQLNQRIIDLIQTGLETEYTEKTPDKLFLILLNATKQLKECYTKGIIKVVKPTHKEPAEE